MSKSDQFSDLKAGRPIPTDDALKLARTALAAGRAPLQAVPNAPEEPSPQTPAEEKVQTAPVADQQAPEEVKVQEPSPAKVHAPSQLKKKSGKPAKRYDPLVPKPSETKPGTKNNPRQLVANPDIRKHQSSIHFEDEVFRGMEYACVALRCSYSEAVNEAVARWLKHPGRRATSVPKK